MRANKSSKNLLRISGLALVFMLAVALLVSAISFTRVGAGVDFKEENVAEASATKKDEDYKDLPSYQDDAWKWVFPLETNHGENAGVLFWAPSNYKNVYFSIGGGYADIGGISRGDSSASCEPTIVSGTRFEMYAYYRLPSFLIDIGAEIEFKLIDDNLNEANLENVLQTNRVKPASLTRSVSLAYEPGNTSNAGGSPSRITESNRYIMIYCGGESSGLSTKMTMSGVRLMVSIKKVNNLDAFYRMFNSKPVTAAWDGTTKTKVPYLLTSYNSVNGYFNTNNNVVGNLGSWGLKDGDSIDSASNTLTSIRTDGQQYKQFSFLLFDKFLKLDKADINGFDLLQAYRNGLQNGKEKIYARSDYTAEQLKTLRYPTGVKSITVRYFTMVESGSNVVGDERGLYVTVVYDGLSNPKNDGEEPQPLEIDTAYRVNYSNSYGISGNPLTVFCGGIDYTVPDALNQVDLLTENIYNEKDGVTYFYTGTVQFKPVLDNDDIRGDVKYYYTLFRKVNGKYEAVEGQIDVAINRPGFDTFTLKNLEKGEYAILFKAVDTLGQYYTNLVAGKTDEEIEGMGLNDYQKSWANHTVYSRYHEFAIDDDKNPPEKWEAAIYLENGGKYNGEWTNQNVVILFNTLSSIKNIRYQISYRNLKNGVFVSAQSDWQDIDIVDNKYIIGEDPTSPEGYERHYYLRAVYESSDITYNITVPVKFDNYKEYMPVVARLLDFTSDAYADLLPLLVTLNYKQIGKDGYVNEFLGSPMKLYYAITRDGVEGKRKELSLTTNDVYMDLFEGKNVAGLTQISVRFWLVDEAGNTNHENNYTVNLDRAKIKIIFDINTNVKRYFNNTTDVSNALVSYTLRNKFAGDIPSKEIGITFNAAYDNVNAGLRNVIISGVQAAYVDGSVYTKALIDEYEKVYVDVNGNVIENNGSFVIGTHEIRKARLTINADYRHAPFTYNGTINYAMPEYAIGDGTLLVFDKVFGDKADEWKSIRWKGMFQIDSIAVNNGLRASVIDIAIAGDLSNNYQITDASGGTSAPKSYIDIQKAKLGKITLIATKVYDGKNTIVTNSGNCSFRIEGLCDTDEGLITLEYDEITIPGKDVNVYAFIINNFKLNGERLKFYDFSDIAVDAQITVTPKTITVKVNDVNKPFDNKTAFQIDSYIFNGVYDGDDVRLYTSAGNTASVNVGTYSNCKVSMRLVGNNSGNYILKETEAVVSVTIASREIGGAKIVGIYAVDPDGNYYYIKKITENEVVVYQKDGTGYRAYSKDGNGKAKSEYVEELPSDATEWVLDTFVMGGVCIINGHRFELSQEVVYAIEYYDDAELKNKLDIGAIDFTERQYQPVVVDQNNKVFVINATGGTFRNGAYEYNLKISRFAAASNFTKKAGYNDKIEKSVSILDFSDIKFVNKLYNEKGDVEGKFNAPYNSKAYTLNIDSASTMTILSVEYFKKDAAGVWQPVENAIDAGQYYGKFTVSRSLNEYILEHSFTIERINTEISLKEALLTYAAKYGEDFAEKVQKLDPSFYDYRDKMGMVIGANDIVFEYSYDRDFETILDSAPVRQGGGTCYVRVRYKGNENFIGSVSGVRAINVSGAKFNLVDISANVGESFSLPTVADVIDPAYRSVAGDFRIVYLVNVGSEEHPDYKFKVVTNVEGLVGDGRYPYTVVHKSLVDQYGYRINDNSKDSRYTLAVSYEGNNTAQINIVENALDSVTGGDAHLSDDDVLEYNELGSISGSWTQADSGYTVYFCVLDRSNAASRDNFTNGLRQNKETFGKEYAANKVFFLTLSEYKNQSVLMNADKQPRLLGTATVTMNVSANGAKLVRYNNGEWTEVNYVDNGDGTVTFETDKLGYFIFTEDYVAPAEKTNVMAIGIGAGVGGAVALAAVVVVVAVVIKRKRA